MEQTSLQDKAGYFYVPKKCQKLLFLVYIEAGESAVHVCSSPMVYGCGLPLWVLERIPIPNALLVIGLLFDFGSLFDIKLH